MDKQLLKLRIRNLQSVNAPMLAKKRDIGGVSVKYLPVRDIDVKRLYDALMVAAAAYDRYQEEPTLKDAHGHFGEQYKWAQEFTKRLEGFYAHGDHQDSKN